MSNEWLSQYEEIKPEEFQAKPFELYHKEWALVTAGTPEKCNSMTIFGVELEHICLFQLQTYM